MICSNNSMLWRTASLFNAVIQVTTRVTCDAWRVHINNDNMETVLGEVQRLSKHFRSFFRAHSVNNEYLYNTYIFWPLFNANCGVLRPQNVCKRSLPGYTPDFSGYNAVKTVVSISVSNSRIYTYSTRWETGYGETVNSYRWRNSCFLWKLSKLRAAATFAITVSWVCNLVTLRLLRRQREYNPQFSGTFKTF